MVDTGAVACTVARALATDAVAMLAVATPAAVTLVVDTRAATPVADFTAGTLIVAAPSEAVAGITVAVAFMAEAASTVVADTVAADIAVADMAVDAGNRFNGCSGNKRLAARELPAFFLLFWACSYVGTSAPA